MSEHSNHEGTDAKTGIFRSSTHHAPKLDEALGSAVSGPAVDQVAVEHPANSLYVGPAAEVSADHLHVGAAEQAGPNDGLTGSAQTQGPPEDQVAVLTAKVEKTQAALEQVNEMLQSVQNSKAELEHKHAEAQQMLAEVEKIHAALTVNDRLRQRIQDTLHRTSQLKSQLGGGSKDEGH